LRGKSRPLPDCPGTPEGRHGLTRRSLGALALAATLAPDFARAHAPDPIIVAEAGSAERPQDSRSAYDLAIDEGCDFIQANLVVAKEGALAVRRDNELSATTDVAARAEFAARKTTKTIEGQALTGWFAEDFTLAELKTLGCKEQWPELRPASAKFNGKDQVLSLRDVLAIARAGCVRTARTIGVIPRIVHARYYADLETPVDDRLASELTTAGYDSRAAAVWVQALDPQALQSFSRTSRLRRMLVVPARAGGDAAAAALTTAAGLTDVRGYADAICADQDLVLDPTGAIFPTPTTLILDARGAGLQVFSFTARLENRFLPKGVQRGNPKSASFAAGHGDVDKLMVALFANGVDGLCTDQPALAVKDRTEAERIIERNRARA
jgi:glycerophosphoryl diester phosphodiesterase